MSTNPRGLDRVLWNFASEIGRTIYTLLIEERSAWTSADGYHLKHSNRPLSIWIANKDYGLKIEFGEAHSQAEIKPKWTDRKLIYRQLKRMNNPTPEYIKHKRAVAAIAALRQHP